MAVELFKLVDGKRVRLTPEEAAQRQADNQAVTGREMRALINLLIAKGIFSKAELTAALDPEV